MMVMTMNWSADMATLFENWDAPENTIMIMMIRVFFTPYLKGSYNNKKFLSPKPHILDSDGVWKSSFWSEEPKNT